MRPLRIYLTFVVAAITAPGLAEAGVILSAASATAEGGTAGGGGSPGNMIDQSGLSVGYTSGVTDFDAYVAGSPTHSGGPVPTNSWFSLFSSVPQNFDFDLGGTFLIGSFAYWGYPNTDQNALTGFDLLADDNAAFTSPTTLGSFVPNTTGPIAATPVQVFEFEATEASFVRMRITSFVAEGEFSPAFGESAFEVVPEPSSLALLSIGTAGIVAYRRRRRREH